MKENPFTSAVQLLEDSLPLSKRAGSDVWCIYLAGVVPFFCFLLFAVTDLFQTQFSTERLLTFTFVLTVLYYWLLVCQSTFASMLYGTLTERPSSGRTSLLNALRTQLPIIGVKLVLWPIGLVLLVPHSVVTSFFQHSLLPLKSLANPDWRSTIHTAMTDARYRPMVALWALVIVFALRVILCANLLALLFVLPQLWKMLSGMENNITRAPAVLLNPTSLAALCTLAYAGLDPIVKAAFVLRRFARESERSGDDLRLRLAMVRKTMAASTLMLLLLLAPSQTWAADQPVTPSKTVTPAQMNQAIRSVFRDPAEIWDIPDTRPQKKHKDAFTAFMDSMVSAVGKAWNALVDAVSAAIDWIKRVLSNGDAGSRNQGLPVSPRQAYLLLACFGGLILIAIIAAVLQRRKRPNSQTAVAAAAVSIIDLRSEETSPMDQSISQWRKLANEYRASGEFRLALRALYLGTLATLAEHSLVSPARGKTNAEYVRELQRRAKRFGAEFASLFVENTRLFERSWYGAHPATDEIVQSFEHNMAALQNQIH